MPTIEDVDFLKKNSTKQDYIFLVDSKDRNKKSYPTPSEYVVDFSAPFQNVIGINVIDATIPRTMYNIDIYNNTLSFAIFDIPAHSNYHLATLEPGDYSIQSFIVELNTKLSMYLNNNSNLPYVSITAAALSTPPDVKNKLTFSCPYPFSFDMANSTVAESLGFDEHTVQTETINYIPNGEQIFNSVDKPFASFSNDTTFIDANAFDLFEGPRGVIRLERLTEPIAQKFYVPFQTNLTRVYAALYTDQLSTSNFASFTIQTDNNNTPSGSNIGSGNIAVSFTDGSLSDSSYLSTPLAQDTSYWVVFNSNQNMNLYYNDTLTSSTTLKLYRNNQWISLDDTTNQIYYQLSIRIQATNDYHKITAPGIYSLVGERYIILRCPEIEDNSFRSLAYTKYNLGIAKFRLGVVGYREERFDYSSVPIREFHPIGRLGRLTLRFQLPDGRLYDFKGVNHTVTFSVRYLEPTANIDFKKSIINTNYNGNFLEYQYTQQQQEEDSDDQDMDYNRDAFNKYKYNEARNLPNQVAQRNLQMYYDLNYGSDEEDAD